MTLVRMKGIICLAIPLMLAFASGDAAVASPAQSGQTVHVDGLDKPVELPVVFPPVTIKKTAPIPTEQELRTRAEAGNVDAMLAYADLLPTPSNFPWYLKAAEGGNPKAMIIVAGNAKEGQTGYGRDLALSDKWSSKALQMGRQALSRRNVEVLNSLLESDQFEDVLDAPTKAQYALAIGRAGGLEIEGGFFRVMDSFPHTPEKIQLVQKCSTSGHPWCTQQLANDYLNGDDGLIIDHALGIKLLTKSAQAGYYGYGLNSPNLSQAEKIQLWKIAIEHGALDYVVSLADAYRDGNGVPKSAPVAAALLRTLIERPDINGSLKGWAIWELASMYVDGKSFPVNEQLFLLTLNSVSSSDSQETIRASLLNGAEGNIDTLNITESTKVLLLKSVAENGPPFNHGNDKNTDYYRYQSALRLGDLYSSGQKVKQSYADAMTWYRKAEQIATDPKAGNSGYDGAAAIKVGMLYEKGLGVPKDSSAAMSWYQKAADYMVSHAGDGGQPIGNLMELLNSVQLPKESVDRVISFIRSSSEAGNAEAQYYFGEMYYEGKYVPQSYSEAIGWFDKCGKSGSGGWWTRSCLETPAKMYMQGQGVTRDPAKVAFYYQKLFDNGWGNFDDPQQEDILLTLYCGGEGIPMDRPKAFALFKNNADKNVPFDELGVGTMYQMGWGVEQDLAEAFNWYRKAAADKNYSSAKAKADFTKIFRDCKGTPENFNAAVSLYDKASGGQH
jgi:TPR repeat protein